SNVEGAPVTVDNPAIPGEFVVVYATGLGLPVLDDNNVSAIQTGIQFPLGGPVTAPNSSVSSLLGGSTADVITATLAPGLVGVFKVTLHLNGGLLTNPVAPLTIAQDIYVSKQVTLPVLNPQ